MGQISRKGNYTLDEGCTQPPRSVVAGEKHCSSRSVGLCDYPKGLTAVDAITTHQAVPVFEAQFIFSLVFLAEIAPVAAKVAREEFERGLLGPLQDSKRGGRSNDLTGGNNGIVGREFIFETHCRWGRENLGWSVPPSASAIFSWMGAGRGTLPGI